MNARKVMYAVFLMTLVITSVGCVDQTADKNRVFENSKTLIEDLQIRMPQISVKDLQTRLENEEELTLIDVRTLKEFNSGGIPGAMSMPRGLLEFSVEKQFPEKTQEIIIYCQKGSRGLLAVDALRRIGYENVKNLEGGLENWKNGGIKGAMEELHEENADDGGGC